MIILTLSWLMTMPHGSALIVMLTLDKQGVRLFVLVHIRIWMCCCLVTMIAIAHYPFAMIHVTTLQLMATAHDSGLTLISAEYTTHCHADFGQTARTFICFGAHSNNAGLWWSQLHTARVLCICMQPHSNGDGLWLRINIDVNGIYDTLLCWLWTNSSYVNLFWCTFEFACVVACWRWCNYT